ncbi:hypothetical protein [Novosphingobium soli]|uniref:Uncharacterized protein n=1 Tax=Novosphingobium soli TaxID=574956 RepID=A0ABV6CUR0_9SPHN
MMASPNFPENDMVRKTTAALVLMLPAVPAPAQDIVPIISPGQAAEGVFHRSRSEAGGNRARQRPAKPLAGTLQARKRACDDRADYRRHYGADHPQVLKLEALCREAGY